MFYKTIGDKKKSYTLRTPLSAWDIAQDDENGTSGSGGESGGGGSSGGDDDEGPAGGQG